MAPRLEEFRQEVRDWIAANLPPDLRHSTLYPSREALRPWLERLSRKGWIAPAWSRRDGGMGASAAERRILMHEMASAGAPNLISPGINFVGPLLIQSGTPEQKAFHLPRILSAEIQWAQGYSEPEAGSDLASLRTAARLEGPDYVVSGHKVWQTLGHACDWMVALVRTDPDASRHAGISMLLIDLASPGITVRPITTITGEDELSEVILDEVRVPAANLVGAAGEGWQLANTLLVHERFTGGSPELSLAMLKRIERLLEAGAAPPEAVLDAVTRAEIELMALEAAYWQAVEEFEATGRQGQAVSLLKVAQTRLQQQLADLLVQVAGCDGALSEIDMPGGRLSVATAFLLSRRATIFGGTREIQLGIIARQSLGLGK